MVLKRLTATQNHSPTSFGPHAGSRAKAALERAGEMQLRSTSVWQRNQLAFQTHQGGSAGSKTVSEPRRQVNAGPWEIIRLQAPSCSPGGALGGQGCKPVLCLARVQTSTPPLLSALGLRKREPCLPSPFPCTRRASAGFGWTGVAWKGRPKASGCCCCPEDRRSLERCCSGPTHYGFGYPITHGFCWAVSAVHTTKEEISSQKEAEILKQYLSPNRWKHC